MGLLFSKVFGKLFGNKEVRVLILGLDNAGKTTILYKLYAPNRVMRTMPTIGFNVESVNYKNLNFSVWDLGGQTNIRPYWRCYYANTNAIIYVVDSCDKERMDIARKELMSMLEEEELKDTKLLVFANKQDQQGAMSVADVSEALGLTTIKDRQWHICKSAAIKNEGLTDGLDWMADAILGVDAKK
jgi:ADP-ribosylation factor-like protein 1